MASPLRNRSSRALELKTIFKNTRVHFPRVDSLIPLDKIILSRIMVRGRTLAAKAIIASPVKRGVHIQSQRS